MSFLPRISYSEFLVLSVRGPFPPWTSRWQCSHPPTSHPPPPPGSIASSQSLAVLCPLSTWRVLVSAGCCSWSSSVIILHFLTTAPNTYISSPKFSTEFHTDKPTFLSIRFTGISTHQSQIRIVILLPKWLSFSPSPTSISSVVLRSISS